MKTLLRSLVLVLGVTLASGAFPVWTAETAQTAQVNDSRLQLLMQDTVTRLKLTPEQQSKLKPLFDERNQKLRALRDKYDARTMRRNGRAMFREAQPIQDDYEKKVRAILDDTQAAEWEKMRQETRERLKELQKAGDGPW